MQCDQAVGPIDAAIALEHIALQAAELGLATCWIGSFYPEKVRPIVGIPQDIAIIELMTVGYPADSRKEPNRQAIEKVVCYEKWRF
jgi:nitroreductase